MIDPSESDADQKARMLDEIEDHLQRTDQLRERQAKLASSLGPPSTHKKLIGQAGRHPVARTVERKALLAVAADFLRAHDKAPLVLYSSSVGFEEGDGPRNDGVSAHRAGSGTSAKVLPKGRRVLARAWRDTSPGLQLLIGHLALASQDDALAFSLNLGTKVLRTMRFLDTQSRNTLRNRIARFLKKEFGLPIRFVFILELDPHGRLHAHGVLGIDPSYLVRVNRALCKAGGAWDASLPHKQCHAEPIYDAAGWASYIAKDMSKLSVQQQTSLIGWSQPMKAIAKAFHNQLRQWLLLNKDAMPTTHSYHYVIDLLRLNS